MVTDHRAGQNSPATPPSGAAMGLILFAGIMMIMAGVFQAIQGIVALVNDTFYVVGQKWVFSFNVTTWGWINLLAGILLALAGLLGGREERVQSAARPVQPKTIALQGETNGQTARSPTFMPEDPQN